MLSHTHTNSDNVPYYIVKNSWSDRYGINGYLKIAIGNNVCGIAERVSAVVV
jgi:Papain family cysteine protease